MNNQDSISACQHTLQQLNQQQIEQFKKSQAIGVLLAERAVATDQLLVQIWQQCQLDQYPLSLVAVGGYGRAELHPRSDIDLLILTEESICTSQEERLGEFLTTLWDAKLDIGHSVRSVAETMRQAKDDVTIATNLLESRLLSGNALNYEQLQQRLTNNEFWPSHSFFSAKYSEQKQRHQKSTSFDLEPNLKSCPGGLRDVQTVTWVAMRHFNATCLVELVSHGYLTKEELEELNACRDFLWRLRFALHCVAGRAEDRLLFDFQKDVAELMGYKDGEQLAAVEQMMKRFYRTVRAVRELNQMLLLLFKQVLSGKSLPSPAPLCELFSQRGHFIEARSQDVFEDSGNILKLFVSLAQNKEVDTVSAATLRLLRNARRKLKNPLAEQEPNRKVFMDILRHRDGIKALSLMHQHGILGAYLKPWQHIVGQMQFDLFHAYTVDEHTHRLLQFIDKFAAPDHKEIFPLGSVLIEQLPKRGLLVLAAIFHDIGKGRGGDHSEIGSEEALRFCEQHNMNSHDGRLVSWLVKHHLVMSVTAQRRDITDPEVIETFANVVKDQNQLSYLYCLTVADICATNNKLWNNWKGSLLRELYHATRNRLNEGMATPVDSRARIRENQAKARNQLQRQGYLDEEINALWQRLSADYFLRFSADQIQLHSEYLINQATPDYLVELSHEPSRGGTELFVHAPDSQGLFTRVMTVLEAKRVQVHDAQIFTTKDGFALDSFMVVEHDGSPLQNPSRISSIRKSLIQVLKREQAPIRKPRQLPRRLRSFSVPTRIKLLSSKRKNSTMIELITLDRPGLLAQIGEVFEQTDVVVKAAKITTVGEKAEDFFQLSTPSGEALDSGTQQHLQQRLIDELTLTKPQT